jgi:hypothetical protein
MPVTATKVTFASWNVIRVVPRRELFVPDVDEGFFYFLATGYGPSSNLKGGTHEHQTKFLEAGSFACGSSLHVFVNHEVQPLHLETWNLKLFI